LADEARSPQPSGVGGFTLSDREIMEELESWKGFGDALKAEDRELFTEMLRECYEYVPSMHAKASPFSAEALLMSVLFVQHKRIARLAKEIEGLRKKER
jgi:hypothetical protein